MPEQFRALIVIIFLASLSMAFMRKPALLLGIAKEDYTRRCITWFWITSAAFITSNFWLFSLAVSAGLLFTSKRDSNPVVLYIFLLFAIPPLTASITGFGVLNQLFELSYSRLLSLLVLLPVFATLVRARSSSKHAFGSVDWLVTAYIFLTLILQLSVDTLTNTLRYGLYHFLDIFLPYYVLSRYVVTIDSRKQVLLAFVLGVLLLCPIAVFEFLKGWLLYAGLPGFLGLPLSDIPAYISRGDNIRAVASSGQPIVLGLLTVVAILLYASIDRNGEKTKYWMLGLAALLAGVVAPLSRGPWVGLVAGLFVLAITSPKPRVWLVRLSVGSLLGIPMMAMTNVGANFIDHLPFIGTVDSNNVDYRSTLIDVAIEVVMLNPFFGSFDFLLHPAFAVLDQGGGAVDLTNTYVVIALSNGLVGLALFVLIFFIASYSILKTLIASGRRESELNTQGRVLLAAIGATLVTIGTVSSISFVPTVYWCLCGLAVGYSRQIHTSLNSTHQQQPRNKIAK